MLSGSSMVHDDALKEGAALTWQQGLLCSIIVPVYNGAATIERCLDALERQSADSDCYEIIVVDDGSSDGTLARMQSWQERHPQVHLIIVEQQNAGPAAARNLGVLQAKAPLLLFTDADCAPLPQWIEALCMPFGRPSSLFSLPPLSEVQADELIVGTKGTYVTEQSSLVAQFVQVEYEERYARMKLHPQIDFIDTYSAAYRRDVFNAHNGFDTRFQIAEDQDLSFRLVAEGYQLRFVAEAQVAHLHVSTVYKYWRRKFWTGYWKAMLVRQHPDRLVQDSHTPQLLKVQMLLSLLILALLLLLPVGMIWPSFRWLWWVFFVAIGIFGLTTAPLVGLLRQRSQHQSTQQKLSHLVIVGPFLIAIRAAALGTGFVLGTIHVLLGKQRGAPSASKPSKQVVEA